MSHVNLYIIKVWTSKGMMKYDGGKVRVGRQKGLFAHKAPDSLQPEKKGVPESSTLDLEMEWTWNRFSF